MYFLSEQEKNTPCSSFAMWSLSVHSLLLAQRIEFLWVTVSHKNIMLIVSLL